MSTDAQVSGPMHEDLQCFTPLAAQESPSHPLVYLQTLIEIRGEVYETLISGVENHRSGISIGLQSSLKWDFSLPSCKSTVSNQKSIPLEKNTYLYSVSVLFPRDSISRWFL